MRDKEISEGLGELADVAERDHEVQMARAELYKLAKYAIKLHDMLKGVSEAEGLEGWVQSKITKSADMIGSVYHHMDYEESPMGEEPMIVGEAKDTHCSDKCCGADVKREDCKCPPTCKHCNCNAVAEGKYKNDAQRKAVHASKAKKGYKESLQDKLSAKLSESENCSECGNPSYKSVSEEKKKGSHGKVCWKGYRRGEGDSCHRVKGDG
jgi:hypothetical protein